MSYSPPRKRNIFNPESFEPYRISRSTLEYFLNCPRCFYLDRRLGVGRPPSFPFNLNSAVDELLKREFDIYREQGIAHPIIEENGIDAIPFKHEMMDDWREALYKGVRYLHEETNFLVTGGVDDVWVSSKGELIVVDYKATSKKGEVSLDAEWQISYKRQMEIYQWLFRRNGFEVSDTGYFVYCNGDKSKDRFDSRLEFKIKLLEYVGSDDWIEPSLMAARDCLCSDQIPEFCVECDYCSYIRAVADVL